MNNLNPPSDQWLEEFFTQPRIIAMIGLSNNRERSAYGVAARLRNLGFRVIPVHPNAEDVAGERAYSTLTDIPEKIDVINVFLRSDRLDSMADAVERVKPGLVWLQEEVRRDDLAKRWAAHGIAVIQDQCLAVMMPRFLAKKS